MIVHPPTVEAIAAAARTLDPGPGQVLAVLLAEHDRPDLDDLVARLRDVTPRFFGAVFPALIDGERRLEQGALLLVLPAERAPMLVRGLDTSDFSLPALDPAPGARGEPTTGLVFVDGLTRNVALLLSRLHGGFGETVRWIGGGAGSLTLQQEPCVFDADGAHQDAAVIVFVEQNCRLGVQHGWQQHAGPVVATRTERNVIHELNWESAFDVYRAAVEPDLAGPLTAENFFDNSKGFPFGIYKEGAEDVVRDPVTVTEDGGLVCVGEVPENVVLNILRGERDALIGAAEQAAASCCEGGPVPGAQALLVDCVSRTLFLEGDFETELGAVRRRLSELDPDVAVRGVLSLGEIATHDEGRVEFFNKTIVAAVLHD